MCSRRAWTLELQFRDGSVGARWNFGFFCGAAKGRALWVFVDTENGRRHPEIGYSVSVGGQNQVSFTCVSCGQLN